MKPQEQVESPKIASESTSATVPMNETIRPLFVDLDGTLIGTDLLHEGYLRAIRAQPSILWKTPSWLALGLATFKQRVATAAPLNASLLPYRSRLVAHLVAERARGKPVILATASPEQWAHPVAEYLGCFDDVIASDATHNRKSSAKLSAIQEWCSLHGYREFDYFGDSAADRKIWAASKVACLVGTGTEFREELIRQGIACEEIAVSTASGKTYLRTLRPHLWLTSFAFFIPHLLSNVVVTQASILSASLALVAFCCCVSAAGIFNDLFDLDGDRQHVKKCGRAIAAGLISIPQAILMIVSLISVASILGLIGLQVRFALGLLGYLAIAVVYSIWIKQLLKINNDRVSHLISAASGVLFVTGAATMKWF